MNCVFEQIGINHYRCAFCGFERKTQTPMDYIHRKCKVASRLTNQPCKYRGLESRQVECGTCGNQTKLVSVYSCSRHGECTVERTRLTGKKIQSCKRCKDYAV